MVKSLRAILLLIIYTAFLSGSTFAVPTCSDFCGNLDTGHVAFGNEGTLPPGECAEKEAVNNLPTEHRVHPSIRLSSGTHQQTSEPIGRNLVTKPLKVKKVRIAQDVLLPPIPLYLSYCVFRC